MPQKDLNTARLECSTPIRFQQSNGRTKSKAERSSIGGASFLSLSEWMAFVWTAVLMRLSCFFMSLFIQLRFALYFLIFPEAEQSPPN